MKPHRTSCLNTYRALTTQRHALWHFSIQHWDSGHLLFRRWRNTPATEQTEPKYENLFSAHVWYDLKILKGDTVPGKRDREFDLVSVFLLVSYYLDRRDEQYFRMCWSETFAIWLEITFCKWKIDQNWRICYQSSPKIEWVSNLYHVTLPMRFYCYFYCRYELRKFHPGPFRNGYFSLTVLPITDGLNARKFYCRNKLAQKILAYEGLQLNDLIQEWSNSNKFTSKFSLKYFNRVN